MWELFSPRIHASPPTWWTVLLTCLGTCLGSSAVNLVFNIRLVQWFVWVFQTKERKKERVRDGPHHQAWSQVVNVVVVGPFEEEHEGTSIASDVVKVKGEDPATPGYNLRSVDTRKPRDRDDSPISGQQYRATHTMGGESRA